MKTIVLTDKEISILKKYIKNVYKITINSDCHYYIEFAEEYSNFFNVKTEFHKLIESITLEKHNGIEENRVKESNDIISKTTMMFCPAICYYVSQDGNCTLKEIYLDGRAKCKNYIDVRPDKNKKSTPYIDKNIKTGDPFIHCCSYPLGFCAGTKESRIKHKIKEYLDDRGKDYNGDQVILAICNLYHLGEIENKEIIEEELNDEEI